MWLFILLNVFYYNPKGANQSCTTGHTLHLMFTLLTKVKYRHILCPLVASASEDSPVRVGPIFLETTFQPL